MSTRLKTILTSFGALALIASVFYTYNLKDKLLAAYSTENSTIVADRHGEIISVKQNSRGFYAMHTNEVPDDFKRVILRSEDRFFYYHPGINPVSTVRATWRHIFSNKNPASSTITQQLVKVLLRQENKRNFGNKLKEAVYALCLDMWVGKNTILSMYANTIYFGNSTQGIVSAARLYFDKEPRELDYSDWTQLVQTIANPTKGNLFATQNISYLGINDSEMKRRKSSWQNLINSPTKFELKDVTADCESSCKLSVDKKLTESIRGVVQRNLRMLDDKNVQNGAVVVLKLPENEVLAIVGSPDPTLEVIGYKINMATANRPIGSTIKPFIYAKAFEKGARPYTLVDDKEYRYTIGSGFSFYPKNYDYQYRGLVNLHYALSNSLNVPAVKVLEYVGLDNFYTFLTDTLKFIPVQPLQKYQLGIALGELEMDLLQLAHYFAIFPNGGHLDGKKIVDQKYIQLINKILNDREAGIEQFGLKSNLNLQQKNYAVKTGTSREYHDGWTVGYTPDFLVAAWVGNSDNTAMDNVSGVTGAGNIWNETMNLLFNSEYNKRTPFNFSLLKEFDTGAGLEYGLSNDDYARQRDLMREDSLILSPHSDDVFLLEKNTKIPLRSGENVEWFVNDVSIGTGKEILWSPNKVGQYAVKARGKKEESVTVLINK